MLKQIHFAIIGTQRKAGSANPEQITWFFSKSCYYLTSNRAEKALLQKMSLWF